MKDAVRYTQIHEADTYADGVRSARAAMRDAGYTEVDWKNSWGGEGYAGINSFWRTADDRGTFEVQFHTPDSFAAKTATHDKIARGRILRHGTLEPTLPIVRSSTTPDRRPEGHRGQEHPVQEGHRAEPAPRQACGHTARAEGP